MNTGGWPNRDTVKKWGIGVALALLPVVYGAYCLISNHATLPNEGGEPLEVYGDAAMALGIVCIAVGLLIHAEWFLAVHRMLWILAEPIKLVAALAVIGGIVFAVFKILA